MNGDGSSTAQLILAVAALITAMAGATATILVAMRESHKATNRKVDAVDRKVDTFNELAVGELEAAKETRRILRMLAAGETINPREQRHIDAAPREE